MGILICGLNGAGKSTLGKALAKRLSFQFIDIEDLYFYKDNPEYTYGDHRSIDEVINLLNNYIEKNKNFIFTAVKGIYGEKLISNLDYIILLEAPKQIRQERIEKRSFEKFGNRILHGGDLYEKENTFFNKVSNRPENFVTEWLKDIDCPVIHIDGTKDIESNVEYLASALKI